MNQASAPLAFRAERFLSGLLAGSRWAPKNPGATILVYHNISPLTDKAALMGDSVTVKDFNSQIHYLLEHKYRIVSLQELVSSLRASRQPLSDTVVITFDDGYKGVFSYAFPILKACGIPATVFLTAKYIGAVGEFPWLNAGTDPSRIEDLRPLSWEEVVLLKGAGVEIGSHSFSHRFLPLLSKEEIRDEVLRSQTVIAESTGTSPCSFALPFSFPLRHRAWPQFAEVLAGSLKQENYSSCCTMARGHVTRCSDPFLLNRMAIMRHDDLASFQAKVTGHYAWTRPFQAFHQNFFKKYR